MNKIFTGNDRARELGLRGYRDMLALFAKRTGHDWRGQVNSDPALALTAFVNAGRWVAECECGEAFFVEPADPIAYCANCGNAVTDGAARAVVFPANRQEVEAALLERPAGGPGKLHAALGTQAQGRAFVPPEAPRNWDAGQTPDELRMEHAMLKQGRKG